MLYFASFTHSLFASFTLVTSRRTFLKSGTLAAIGGAAFTIVPRHVLGKGFIAPSDKLNIAAVGCGGKADTNIQSSHNGGTDNIVALCDVDERQAAKYRAQFPKAPFFRDYREMLDKAGTAIDAVIISTPDHMHAPIAMAAMNLGKHVYVEKPMTINKATAIEMTNTANAAGIKMVVAHYRRQIPYFKKIKQFTYCINYQWLKCRP